MPFGHGLDDIDRIIGEAARECELEYIRGDRRHQPGSILPQILQDIRQATVVVADISGHNPNVFYELGIAHHLLGSKRVVILTNDAQPSPYDVHEFRQLVYRHNEEGRAALRRTLPGFLRAAATAQDDEEIWNIIRGRLPRTKLLVRALRQLIDSAGPRRLDGVTIRVIAGLGSLAISDHEPHDPGVNFEYHSALVAERNTLREALAKGAELKGVLNPPRRFAQSMLPERLRVRFERMLGLLNGRSDITDDEQAAAGDLAAIKQCKFALTPVPMPNLFIIGERLAYEGMKRGGTGGFEMTHCETSVEALGNLIRQFDQLFDDSCREMIRTHPPDGQLLMQLRQFYKDATGEEASSV